MEVDPMLRITAQDALWHEWIAGNGALEKNLKAGVCAQFEKNFAKAKWRKAIRVTTFMQRLRAPDASGEGISSRLPVTPCSSMSVSHEVTIENNPKQQNNDTVITDEKPKPSILIPDPSPGFLTVANLEHPPEHSRCPPLPPLTHLSPSQKDVMQELKKSSPAEKRVDASSSQQTRPRKSTAVLDQANEKTLVSADQNGKNKAIIKESNEKKTTIYQDMKAVPSKKITENITPTFPDQHEHKKVILLDSVTEVKSQLSSLSSLSSQKLPGVSEQSKRKMAAVLDQDPERKSDQQRPSFQEQRKRQDFPAYDERDKIGSFADQGEWRMDRVIEQIEKQMAAVLEKIEGEIPCLLEQIGEKGDPTALEYKETHIVAALDQSRSVLEQNEGSYNQKGAVRFSRPSLPVLTILPKDVQSEETCIEGEDDTDTEKVKKESMSLDKI
ncbi:CAMKV protein, partial [Polypterus senegalus]